MVLGDADGNNERYKDLENLIEGLPDNLISREEKTRNLNKGDNLMMSQTGKSTWTDSDQDWETALSAANYFASSIILDGITGKEDKSKKHFDKAMQLCRSLNKTHVDQGNAETPDLALSAGTEV